MKNKIFLGLIFLLTQNCFGTKIVNGTSSKKFVYINDFNAIELTANNGECNLDDYISALDSEYLNIALVFDSTHDYKVRFAFSAPTFKYQKSSIKDSNIFYITEMMGPYPKINLRYKLSILCTIYQSQEELDKFLKSEKKE